MQVTLAASAAARKEARANRASQEEGRAASTTDAVDQLMKGKKETENVRATYNAADDTDAYFADKTNLAIVPQADGYGDLMAPFSGFYDDVNYPVTTLFYPPHAPSEMPPRVQMPPRPPPVFKNVLALAGERENDAQLMVSKIWRGIMTRRNLQNSRMHTHIVNYRARMIQCWWRSITAQARHKQLAALKKEWVVKRAASYVDNKMKGLANMMTWQRCRFEGAAITIQRVVRWHLRWCARRRCREAGTPESEWPEELEFPIAHKTTRYFWWRRSPSEVEAKAAAIAALLASGDAKPEEEEPRRRTILEFKKERDPVQPPPQTNVEADNATMRQRTRSRAVSLAQPEVQSRKEWKSDGIRREDLDFNAGVIQRLFRSQRSGSHVLTVEVTKSYMDNIVRIIARTFRMYILVQHLRTHRRGIERQVRTRLDKYSRTKIAEIEHKVVWGKELLDASARTIQQCWHHYRFSRFGVLPYRIQSELDRRAALAQKKADLEEAKRVEREETIRRLKEDLGVDAIPAAAPAAEPKAEGEGEGEDEEEAQQQDEEAPEADAPMTEELAEQQRQAQEEEDQRREAQRLAEEAEFEELETPYTYENPTAPPYRLIDDYLAREEELRDAMLNLLDRNKKEMIKSHKYVTYTPEKVIVRKDMNTFVPKVQ